MFEANSFCFNFLFLIDWDMLVKLTWHRDHLMKMDFYFEENLAVIDAYFGTSNNVVVGTITISMFCW